MLFFPYKEEETNVRSEETRGCCPCLQFPQCFFILISYLHVYIYSTKNTELWMLSCENNKENTLPVCMLYCKHRPYLSPLSAD